MAEIREVVIVAAARTPIGSFNGTLKDIPATRLGSIAIKAVIERAGIDPQIVDEVIMGNVLPANEGQAPARQAALGAGLGKSVQCVTINKVCGSGLKSVMLAAQAIMVSDADVIIAGGMENMSTIPHYFNARNGIKLGDVKMTDGMVKDGLTDVYNKVHMGTFADLCASEYKISRERQDAFAIESYNRSTKSWNENRFKDEIVPVEIPQRRGEAKIVAQDEEFTNVKIDKIPNLRAVFTKEGSVTAANASTLNDGAAAVVVMSLEKANELGLKPLAKIIGYADAAQDPKWFTTAPAKAVPLAVKKAGITMDDVEYYELNEAFSVVGLVNMDLMKLDPAKVNVNGGAVSLGHPLGMSGTRIIMSLITVLQQNNAKTGAVGICNGGGGAGAMVIERM